MIIKVTFRDNDCTNLLEEYFNKPLFIQIRNLLEDIKYSDKLEDIKKYCELSKLIDNCMEYAVYNKEIDIELNQSLINLIKESIIKYIGNNEYLINNLEITIVNELQDIDENGEVVYYLTKADKSIIM